MSETACGSKVSYTYKGTAYEIPADLLALQRSWTTAHAECLRLERDTGPEALAAYEAARETRMAATLAKLDHPWLTGHRTFDHARDLALRAAAV